MHYAVIAAGEGSRLLEDGVTLPKPLIQLSGRPMLERLLDIMVCNQAECICVIVNQQMPSVQTFLEKWHAIHPSVDLRVLVKSTPSSMHSLSALCAVLPDGPFVCTTVDTLFTQREFASYITTFASMHSSDCLFVVTPFVEDEKPLWIETDGEGVITRFCDQGPAPYVSGGIYGMNKAQIVPILDRCLAEGKSRMRNFQRALLEEGLKVRSYVFEKIMDIDHRSDIDHAEHWLAQIQEG